MCALSYMCDFVAYLSLSPCICSHIDNHPSADPPSVVVDLVDIVAEVGDTVSASCRAFGVPPPTVTWWTEGQNLSSLPGISVSYGSWTDVLGRIVIIANFTIHSVDLNDARVYNCSAVNGIPNYIETPEFDTAEVFIEGNLAELTNEYENYDS